MSTAAAPMPAPVHSAARRRLPRDVLALARIEGRRLVLHPVFLAGVLLSVGFVAFVWTRPDPRSFGMLVSGYAVLPLAAATLIAANQGALRSRRDNTEELYASLPRRRSSRTAGQLLGLLWTLPVSGALLGGAYLLVSARGFEGPRGGPIPFDGATAVELAQGPLAVLALGAVGIALARIAPAAMAAVLLVIAGFFLEVELTYWIVGQQAVEGRSPAWVRWLVPMANDAVETAQPCPPGVSMPGGNGAECMSIDLYHDVSGLAWHVACLAAVTGLAAAAALVRSLRTRASLVALIALVAVATALAAG
jgi:hypothetical protein